MKKHLFLFAACVAAIAILSWQSPVVFAQHSHGHGHGHSHGHGYSHGRSHIHFGHSHVLPHYNHHYHGSYWVDSGLYYYQPRTYVADPGTYVVAKPIAVEFGSFSHVDDLAGRLERLANELCLDMHYNYSHNPGYGETYRDAYQILNIAKYIHTKEHQQDRAEVARRVAELDPLFHQVNAEIRGWSRQHRRQIGQAGVMGKLEMMEATLHHLMNDAGVRPDEVHAGQGAPAPAVDEVAPPPSPVEATTVTTPPPSLQ